MTVRRTLPLVLTVLVLSGVAIGGAAQAGQAVQLAPAPTANLWVDRDGGGCARSGKAAGYRDATACGSIDAAWDACRPGDRIVLKAGVYGEQTITGDKAAPGCTVRGERGTVIGDLVTGGAFFNLGNVTIDVGEAKHAGWKVSASNVTLSNVGLHGPFVRVDIFRVSNIRWLGGELGTAGKTGGRRICGRDALPVQIGEADHITFEGISFHPQDVDPTPSSCSANGFHLEMIRLDGGTSFFTLRNSTFDNGDHSGTASVFITEPGGDFEPHDLTFENNFFGTNESVGAFDVHANVSRCVNFTFAYNTFLKTPGLFQCTSVVNVKWIGNLGANGPSSPCFGTSTNNVWQDPRRDNCGSDKWVSGARGETDRLGLGGADGFRIQAGSPAINAAEGSGYCTTTLRARDRGGQGRPRGTRCDAGADEYDAPGRGPVGASLGATGWSRTRSGARILVLTLRLDESVAAEVRLVQGSRELARRSYARLREGTRTTTLALGEGVGPGRARVRILFEDAARDQKVVQRAVQIPR